jgi:hypothetical protein
VAQLASLGILKAARNSALLQIGFFGGLRRIELVCIKVEQVAGTEEGIVIMLPCSKTDQLVEGIVKGIPYSAGLCCPAAAMRRLLDAAGIAAGPVFRR